MKRRIPRCLAAIAISFGVAVSPRPAIPRPVPTVHAGEAPSAAGPPAGSSATRLAPSPRGAPGPTTSLLAPGPESCEQAASMAEATYNLPAGLLFAIGRIESGRWSAAQGRTAPWPWTINAAGKGQWFETRDAAIQAVETLRATGTRSIDTGCFQISLLHHPGAFADLTQAFDPGANAAYAARFLRALFARAGSWEGAVENYHSADPVRGLAYRQQVFAVWLAPGTTPPMVRAGMPQGLVPSTGLAPATSDAAAQPNITGDGLPRAIAGVRVWTPMEAGTAPDRVAMPPPFRPIRKPPVSN